jgi:hypothetical protein
VDKRFVVCPWSVSIQAIAHVSSVDAGGRESGL